MSCIDLFFENPLIYFLGVFFTVWIFVFIIHAIKYFKCKEHQEFR